MKSDGLPKSKESKKPAEHSMTPFMDILGLEEDHIEGSVECKMIGNQFTTSGCLDDR